MKIKANNVRMSFCELFEARDYNGDGKFKFSATFLIDKQHKELTDRIEAAIKKVATDKWGARADAVLKSIRGNSNKFNFRDGEEKPEYDGYAGHMYLKASNKARPLIVDRNNTPLIAADGRPYPGCYVNAVFTPFAYDREGIKGISASLGGVQFYRDGDAFTGGGVASEDDFDCISEGAEAESLV